jgi:hypothetical protein
LLIISQLTPSREFSFEQEKVARQLENCRRRVNFFLHCAPKKRGEKENKEKMNDKEEINFILQFYKKKNL